MKNAIITFLNRILLWVSFEIPIVGCDQKNLIDFKISLIDDDIRLVDDDTRLIDFFSLIDFDDVRQFYKLEILTIEI